MLNVFHSLRVECNFCTRLEAGLLKYAGTRTLMSPASGHLLHCWRMWGAVAACRSRACREAPLQAAGLAQLVMVSALQSASAASLHPHHRV